MSGQSRPWWSRFTLLQLVISTCVLLGGLAAWWLFMAGDLRMVTAGCSIGYMVLMGGWATRRVANALAAVLEERNTDPIHGDAPFGRVFEAALLPIYCASFLLLIAVIVSGTGDAQQGSFLDRWYGTLSYVGGGLTGIAASAIVLLSIWRRQNRAGWVAVIVAQAAGAATVTASFFLSLPGLLPAERVDTWYAWQASPSILWLVSLVICVLLGMVVIARLWRLADREARVPWVSLLALVILAGYFAGFGRLTGFWPSSWLYGAFFMARIAAYVVFLFESKDGPVLRSGWFACYLAAALLCIAATVHTMTTGDFGMMTQPLLMMPLPPVGMSGSPWGFGPSLLLTLTRDLLFLLWLARLRPGWGEAAGLAILLLLYGPVAIALAMLGFTFLFPAFYPLFVAGPVDLIWPLAMIGALVALLLHLRRDVPATNSLV